MFLSILSIVMWKASMVLKKDVMWRGFPLLKFDTIAQLVPFLVACVVLTNSINNIWNITYIVIAFALWVIYFFGRNATAYVLKYEKLSTITPYENLGPLLTIVFSFLIFRDTSIISFIIAILTIFILFWTSFDYKNLKFSKNILIFIWWRLASSTWNIILWYLLLKNSAFDIFMVYMFASFLFSLWLLIIKSRKEKTLLGKFFEQKIDIFKTIICWNIWWWWWFISLVIIKNVWLTVATLLSFLWLIVWYIFYYFFLWDKPDKRSILLAVLVTILVWLWYYFK